MKRLFPDARLLFTDTDSAMYQVFGRRDPVEVLAAANERGDMPRFFDVVNKAKQSDLSGLTQEQRTMAFERRNELGAFGIEYFPARISSYAGLRAKVYTWRPVPSPFLALGLNFLGLGRTYR